ncbi:uncharacterized protein N7473_000102 [Penicillium subrubescens]|uniref:uncharacterized protein n=1 Tax=Penicillium subrubescens TaxID=1316194 RepID=UPI0025455F82|nr:uncharacterized protein N7473_000102 [Penicillium subrubescens]KAJ5910799.1 hypothetical protein N7473_000102 [Penicillium subrubescens]
MWAWARKKGYQIPAWYQRDKSSVRTDEVESEVPGAGVSGEDKILDDPSRYDFKDGSSGDSWRRVLICMPGITDFRGVFDMDGDGSNMQYISGQHDEDMVARRQEIEETWWRDLSLAQLRIQPGGPVPVGS